MLAIEQKNEISLLFQFYIEKIPLNVVAIFDALRVQRTLHYIQILNLLTAYNTE